MKLAMLNITLEDKLEHPEHYPDAGEHIVQRVVAVKDVYDVLQGTSVSCTISPQCLTSNYRAQNTQSK